MHRVLSWKRLLIVVGVFVVLSATAAGVYRVQSKRHAAILKTRAEKEVAAAGGDLSKTDEAATLYARYLKFNPRDEEAFAKYAELMLARADADPRKHAQPTADALAAFLRQFPDHPDQRRKLIDLYIKLGLFNTAREHLTMLFNTPGAAFNKDPELLDRSATCAEVGGDIAGAVKDLDDAIETGKAPVKTFERMLMLLRANPSSFGPNYTVSKYLEKLITDEPYKSSVAARVVAGRFLLHREPENARTYINHALNVMPGGSGNPDALLVAAELALVDAAKDEKTAAEHLNVAKGYLEKAFSIDPKDIRIGIMYADSLETAKERPKAIEVLRKSADALGEPNDQFLRVVDRLLDYGELEQSAKLIDRLETNDVDRVRVAKYFRGRLAVIKKDWGQARALLEEVAPVLIRVPEFHKKALTDLAQCYGILQNPDKQLEHSTAALKDDPSYLPAVLANAEALSKLGRVREALPKYRLLVYAHRLEAVRATLVRLEYLDTLMTPVGVRNWAKFEEALGPPDKRTPEINIVHAEALAARGDFAAANDLIKAVLKADPKNGPALMALARGGRGETRPEVVLAGLEKARAEFGDSLEMRLALAAVLPYRTKRPTPDEFRAIAADTGEYGKPALQRLWFALGEATMRAAGNNPDPKAAGDMRLLAVEFFEKSARVEPMDLVSRAILIDLGISTENPALIERSLKEIAGIEGDRGPIGTIGRVAARLPEVSKMNDKAARAASVKELREDAKRVKGIRPAWPRIYIALAQLDEIEGLNNSALTNYMEAIDKGDRQVSVIRRMVELYRERKEDDKATAVLNKLAAEINLPDDIERFRSIRNLLARDVPKDQRPTIERIAPLDSKDYRILLLRGALLAAIRADADAEVAFRAAVSVGDHVPETWSALVTHLARQQKPEQAKAAIAEAEAKLRAKPNQTAAAKGEVLLTLAGCYEIVGDLTTAAERYQEAVEAAPQELSMHRQWVRFLQRHGQQAQAAELLKKLSESPAQDLARWGRRNLAMSLVVGRRAYSQRFAALNLIDQNLKADANDPEDVKARAAVQTIDPVTREEGITKLREFAGRYELTPEEFYLLARMYFDQGKIAESLDYFTYAARPQPGVTLQHMSGLIRCHLALNRPDRAQDVLERMKTAAPASWEAARDEALILSRQGSDAEKRGNATEAKKLREQARDRLLKYPGQRTEAFVTRELGPALEELGFLQDAELAYTQLMDKGTSPAPHLPLCIYLIMQKRTDQAIKLAKLHDTPKTPVAVTAQLLSGAVRAKNPGGSEEKFVENWLAEKMRAYQGKPEFPSLVAAKAELLDAQEKYEEAIAEYRKATEFDSADLSDGVKNNLASLVALHKPAEVDTAIKIMTELIGVRGPSPAFLDTRAVAYIVKGTPELAVKDLELALVQQRKPLYLFHLGWAYDLIADKRPLSGRTIDEAKQLGMTADLLHPLELKKFGNRYGLKGK